MRSARTLYGLSPYAKSIRTQTAHFVSYSSASVPERCLMSAYSLRTRGFIRGSIPLSSTIKRLVRRGSGRANGQKPKMYGHADRIDGQGKGSGKLLVLLDCCVHTAYSCPMTTSENAQRDDSIRAYSVLKQAAVALHDWQEARRQHLDVVKRAVKDIEHADECIAHNSNLLREALLELGFTATPEAEVRHE